MPNKANPFTETFPIRASVRGLIEAPVQGYLDLKMRSTHNHDVFMPLTKLAWINGKPMAPKVAKQILASSGNDSDANEFRGVAAMWLLMHFCVAVKAAAAVTPTLAWHATGGASNGSVPSKFGKSYVAFQRA